MNMGRRWHFEMMRQRWALDKMGVVGKEINFAKNPNKIVMTRVQSPSVFVLGAASSKFQSAVGIDVQFACRHAINSHPSPASVPGSLHLIWHSRQSITYTPRRSQHTFASPQIEKKKKAMNACMCLATCNTATSRCMLSCATKVCPCWCSGRMSSRAS